MNCSALGNWDAECTCGLEWRIQLQTEQEMHNAWRKRAEEAEKELSEARHEMSQCDDIALDRPLAHCINQLQRAREAAYELGHADGSAQQRLPRRSHPWSAKRRKAREANA